MDISRKDLSTGAIFIAFGAVYGYQSGFGMSVGSLNRMGPGYFPLALSVILVCIGLAVAIRGLRPARGASSEPGAPIPWRPILFISAATLVFAVLAGRLGMLPVTFVSMLIASFARTGTTFVKAVVMAASIAVFCSLLFTYALGLPLPVFGTWFR